MDCIIKFVLGYGLIPTCQHGSFYGRSIITNLLDCVNYRSKYLDEGPLVDVEYLDFCRVFDHAHLIRLLYKLEHFCVQFHTLPWIRDFCLIGTFMFV